MYIYIIWYNSNIYYIEYNIYILVIIYTICKYNSNKTNNYYRYITNICMTICVYITIIYYIYICINILFFIVHVFNFQTSVGNCSPGCNPEVTKWGGKLRKTEEFGDHYNQQTWGCFKNLGICISTCMCIYIHTYVYIIYIQYYTIYMYLYVDIYIYM